jgi:hypothetical protein
MHISVAIVTLSIAATCGLVVAIPTASLSTKPSTGETDGAQSFPYTPETLTATTIFDDEHGFRNISYFIDDGSVIVESDIIFGTVEDLHRGEARAHAAIASDSHLARRAYVLTNIPWYDATIRYHYATPGSRVNFKDKVEAAIARWKAGAPYLQFQEVNAGWSGDWNHPVLTIYGEGQNGCYSAIGYAPGSQPKMQLGAGCNTPEVAHEFGHVLGMINRVNLFLVLKRLVYLANTSPRPSTRAHPPRSRQPRQHLVGQRQPRG